MFYHTKLMRIISYDEMIVNAIFFHYSSILGILKVIISFLDKIFELYYNKYKNNIRRLL